MRLRMSILVIVSIPAFVAPMQAQIFRKAQPKVSTPAAVPELLTVIKADKDDRKRVAAIGELRNADAKTHPEIVPVLIEVLLQDQRPNLRLEAAQTLGRIRPPSPAAAQALEQAASRDSSRWVRLHSRTALVGYKLAGQGEKNVSSEKSAPKATKTASTAPPPRIVDKAPTPKVAGPKIVEKAPTPAASVPRPLPSDATWSTAVPVPPSRATPPPALIGEGPVLAPPK